MNKNILLVMPVPFQKVDGRLGLDDQTCQGLVRWAENFDKVTMACPLLPRKVLINSSATLTWQAIEDLPCAENLELIPLPYAYKEVDFFTTYTQTRSLLSRKIRENEYLCFAAGGFIGDWGAIACLEAIKQKRPYAIWLDRVEYEVARRTAHQQKLRRRFKYLFTLPATKYYQRYLVRNARIGLFQGQDCYSEYSPFCQQPYCVYDVHTQKSDQIDNIKLNQKINSVLSGETLRICYVGRAAEMKGPLDWLQVIYRLLQNGIKLEATWLGDGPLLQEMNSFVKSRDLEQYIKFSGFVDNREQIFQTMKNNHLLVFCHKTPESPRCLVESLVCGTPIVGYGSAYSQGLVSEYGGGVFVPINEWEKLADTIIELNGNRPKLANLIQQAAKSGTIYDEETVFENRSNLIKKYSSNLTSDNNLYIHPEKVKQYSFKALYNKNYKNNNLKKIKVNSQIFPKKK